jgi:hypothetical protein
MRLTSLTKERRGLPSKKKTRKRTKEERKRIPMVAETLMVGANESCIDRNTECSQSRTGPVTVAQTSALFPWSQHLHPEDIIGRQGIIPTR